MSAVCVFTPIVVASWPLLHAAATAAATSLGFSIVSAATLPKQSTQLEQRIELEVPHSEVVGTRSQQASRLLLKQGDTSVELKVDAANRLKVCVTGKASRTELERIGKEISGRVVQQYAYHKLVTELKQRRYQVVNEALETDQSIKLRIRAA